jgi:DNA-binding CsgD family transcriptional regulator
MYGSFSSAAFSARAWNNVARRLELSPRELNIVHGLFDGLTESAMASRFHISPHTVHTHVERLHQKLHVTHRVALALRVIQEFLKLAGVPGSGVPPFCVWRGGGNCGLNGRRPHAGRRRRRGVSAE